MTEHIELPEVIDRRRLAKRHHCRLIAWQLTAKGRARLRRAAEDEHPVKLAIWIGRQQVFVTARPFFFNRRGHAARWPLDDPIARGGQKRSPMRQELGSNRREASDRRASLSVRHHFGSDRRACRIDLFLRPRQAGN